MSPHVSIIIPCRNGELYLAETLASVLAQDLQDIEVIVVDNGSTDGSARIAAGLGERVRVISEPEPDIGLARNRGVAAARAAIVGFCDADDLWDTRRLPGQLAHLETLPDLAISTGLQQPFISPEIELTAAARAAFDDRPQFFRTPGTMLIRRSLLEKVGPFPTGGEHDMLAWIGHAADLGVAFARLERVVLHRRVHRLNHSIVEGRRTADFARSLKTLLDKRRLAARDGA